MAMSVMVLMPFADTLRDHYELGIKPAVVRAGCRCIRVDEEFILDDVVSQMRRLIAEADILVAEVSQPNPNVYYEVGYAHGLGKDVLFLADRAEGLPFDTRGIQHIVYKDITDLGASLEEALTRWKSQTELVTDQLWESVGMEALRKESQAVLRYLSSCEDGEASAVECALQARGLYAVLNDLRFLGLVEFRGPLRATVRVRVTQTGRRLLSDQP